jgi:hypothetical protein
MDSFDEIQCEEIHWSDYETVDLYCEKCLEHFMNCECGTELDERPLIEDED